MTKKRAVTTTNNGSISIRLNTLQLISGPKVSRIFEEKYQDILTVEYDAASEFIAELWSRYEQGAPVTNGLVFEGLLATVFYREGILPLYAQAKLAFVPNIEFDFVAYTEEYGPVILSAKTSLRERYKQADLEGMMVRQVHRKSKSFLLTLHATEADTVNDKIANGLVLGIDKVVLADQAGFDNLIHELKGLTYSQPEKIDVLTSKRLIAGD